MRASALVLAILVAGPALAGCVTPGATETDSLAVPRAGDRATYAVAGHLVEIARWANGFALPGANARLTLAVDPAPSVVDGARAAHDVFRVREEVGDAAGMSPHRDLYVSAALGVVVQSFAPITGDDAVVAFDERGYPWAWGASAWHGAPLEVGARLDLHLHANGGQPFPLSLAMRVEARETVGGYDAYRVALAPSHGWFNATFGRPDGAWHVWLAPDVPFPVRVAIDLPPGPLAPFVRFDDGNAARFTFTADLLDFERGRGAFLAREPDGALPDHAPEAVFSAWNREMPPDGGRDYSPFLLSEAVAWARFFDPGFSDWRNGHPDAILYRATYLSKDADATGLGLPLPGARTHVWLVQYVTRDDKYYEVQVERTLATGAPRDAPGATRVVSSGPVPPPDGNHGWIDTSHLPDRLLTLDSGVAVMRSFFHPDGVEIFLRSFADPPGYAYYTDGGFDGDGRYTVIVNAQTGFVQAAVGPVAPVLAP